MAETGYQPVPHDAAFRKALLNKPGRKQSFDALEEEYTALHALWDARQAAGLTQADVASAWAPQCPPCHGLNRLAQRKAFTSVCHPAQVCAGLWQEVGHSNGVKLLHFSKPFALIARTPGLFGTDN